MSEPELATKAPESDAMEDQKPSAEQTSGEQPQPTSATSDTTTTKQSDISAQDSVAQSGPTMGEHCVSDRPPPINTSSSGEIAELGGVDTYISKPADVSFASPGK